MQYTDAASLFRTGVYGVQFLSEFMDKIGNDSREFRTSLTNLSNEATTSGDNESFREGLKELAISYKATSRRNANVARNYIHAIAEGYFGGFLTAQIRNQADVDHAVELRTMFAQRIQGREFAILIENIITQVDTLAGLANAPQPREDVQNALIDAIREVEGIADAFSLLEEFFVRVFLLINRRIRDSGFEPPNEAELPTATRSALRSMRRSFEPVYDEDIIIWRYFDFPKFVALLEREELFFPSVEMLTKYADALEGEFTAADKDLFDEMFMEYPFIQKVITEMGNDLKGVTYVSSWHIRDEESAEMWNTYTKSNGVAIRTTSRRLLSSLCATADLDVYVTRVSYINPDTDHTTLQGILSSFVNKINTFAFEKELRVMFVDALRAPNGASLEVNIEELCESVVVNPGCEEWIRELVEQMFKRRGVDIRVAHSVLSDRL